MSKLKIGDKVEIIGHHWEDGREVEDMQYVIGRGGTITGTGDPYYDVSIEGENSDWGILPSDLKLIKVEKTTNTTKRVEIRIEDGVAGVNHVTNTKKNRVTLLHSGSKTGTIKFAEIDKYIELLTQLKSEV